MGQDPMIEKIIDIEEKEAVEGELITFEPERPLFVEVQDIDGDRRQFIEVRALRRAWPTDNGGSFLQLDGWTVAIKETPEQFLARIGATIIPLPIVEPAVDPNEPWDYFGVKMHPVKSSNVKAIGWRSDTNVLTVAFLSDEVYTYEPVSQSMFDAFMGAESYGKYLNGSIKPLVKAGAITCTKVGTLS